MTSTFDETATRETPEHQGYNWLGSLETVDASSEYHHRAGNSTMTLSFRGSLKTTNRFLDPASRSDWAGNLGGTAVGEAKVRTGSQTFTREDGS
ncbi:hypothetical protein, partial [Zavarzinella formosa]